MKLRSLALLSLALTATAAGIACGSADDANSAFEGDAGSPVADSGVGATLGDGGVTSVANGVLLVHAAAFPAFRLCFENYPDIYPQPDEKVLPQANVVGVELGGVVRIGPMTRPPGKVYVINQKASPTHANDPRALPCGDFVKSLDYPSQYAFAGSIDRPVGVGAAEIIAVTGCGNAGFLFGLKIPQSDCANYDETASGAGNLQTTVLSLRTTNTSTLSTLPVQLISLATKLDELKPANHVIDVSFGPFADAGAGRLDRIVATEPELYDASAPVVLAVDQKAESAFGSYGFRVAYLPADGELIGDAAPPFSLDQTLAQVQEGSKPSANPTSYFLTPSNYALLLLGDPRMTPAFVDGGPNDKYDPRRAVHILAIPVRDEIDAAPLGEAPNAGAAPKSDAGSDAAP